MSELTVDREALLAGLPVQYRNLVRTMLDTGATGSVKLGPVRIESEGLTLQFTSVELVIQPRPKAKGGAK